MSGQCTCGHDAAVHDHHSERCAGDCWDDHYETSYRCLCVQFEPQA